MTLQFLKWQQNPSFVESFLREKLLIKMNSFLILMYKITRVYALIIIIITMIIIIIITMIIIII